MTNIKVVVTDDGKGTHKAVFTRNGRKFILPNVRIELIETDGEDTEDLTVGVIRKGGE